MQLGNDEFDLGVAAFIEEDYCLAASDMIDAANSFLNAFIDYEIAESSFQDAQSYYQQAIKKFPIQKIVDNVISGR